VKSGDALEAFPNAVKVRANRVSPVGHGAKLDVQGSRFLGQLQGSKALPAELVSNSTVRPEVRKTLAVQTPARTVRCIWLLNPPTQTYFTGPDRSKRPSAWKSTSIAHGKSFADKVASTAPLTSWNSS